MHSPVMLPACCRESEITHGRVAMLAVVGWLVGEAVADNKLLVNYDGRITGECFLDQDINTPQMQWSRHLLLQCFQQAWHCLGVLEASDYYIVPPSGAPVLCTCAWCWARVRQCPLCCTRSTRPS